MTGDAERIRALVIDHPLRRDAAEPALLATIDPADWEGLPVPLREWTIREMLLCGSATLLTGAGSSGKSLFGQQSATCTALGRLLMGMETRQTKSLYLTCEDDADELHRRQERICELLDVNFSELSGKLFLVSLVNQTANELCTFDTAGRMETTPAWDRLRATVLSLGIGYLVLDNIAHLFAGNENDRHQVAAFCGLLNSLAAEAGAAILFIGHPNKAGDSFSGSTAWENQVRQRLFLERPKGDDGEVLDPDARVLRREKANYARHGEEIEFRWYRGAFVRPEDLPAGRADVVDETTTMRADEERFLACLAKAAAERRATSPSPMASNYAPRMFTTMPTGKGVTLKRFQEAMRRLLDSGAILNGERVYQRENRTWAPGLGPAQTLAQTTAQTFAQGCTDLRENP